MASVYMMALITILLTFAAVTSAYTKRFVNDKGSSGSSSFAFSSYTSNVCYIQTNDGCKYRVTVLPASCDHASDEGWKAGHGERRKEESEKDGDEFGIAGATDDVNSLKKLEALEQKLVKMMEDLSVRSLRHVREIRSDLRQMTNSMNSLKDRNEKAMYDGRTSPQKQCPSEFISMGTSRSCYRFSNFEASWHEAREYCNAFGAGLLSLDSMKEAYIIDYLIKSNQAFQEPKGWWTSGNYVVRSQRWVWSSGHQQYTPIGFSRWAQGEPNARSTMHCMVLFKPDRYSWHDATCSDRYNFICELEQN